MRLILAFILSASALFAAASVSFNRDVRPILAESCFECHGPTKAKGGLRLDQEASATNVLQSGAVAVRAGRSFASEAIRRLQSADVDEQMPPRESGKPALSEVKIAALKRWIDEGAKFERHWALEKMVRSPVPNPIDPARAANAIDAFIQRSVSTIGLKMSPRANDRVLRRRLAFDLTGLPPANDIEELAWEATVDRLLGSPAFGERMAVWWLDLVRYADSEGYFFDSYRNIYPYRDYVVRSFNANKGFDRFTLEQIAGDLLPGAGWEEKIGSGYNRLILTTHEEGANEGEYRARFAADRVRNLGSVWLGMTLGCAECHDHKFDPIPAADFYRTAAFFADIKEEAVNRQPEVVVTSRSAEDRELKARIAVLRHERASGMPSADCAQAIAEEELLATGMAPASWPPGPRTDKMTLSLRRCAEGKAENEERNEVAKYFRRHYFKSIEIELARLNGQRMANEAKAPLSLVTERGPIRTVRVLARGDWLDTSGPEVRPRAPGFGVEVAESPERANRLDLARWLVSAENPLTARVIVNRLWQVFFLSGMVRSVDDFGMQGEAPNNPELLDWLASEFIASGWNIKHLVRLIVTSETYRQSSNVTADALEKDPENKLFARQNRGSLGAEFVRDNALAMAGLLSGVIGGPPVKSYVPVGFIRPIDMLDEEPYLVAEGERLYRRGLYLVRKRSLLQPTLAAFEASTREECASVRSKASTPKAALALLNAPAFVEAARGFAERLSSAAETDGGRIEAAFQIALGRDPMAAESKILLQMLASDRTTFGQDKIAAAQFLRAGHYRWPSNMDAVELAAWTNIARAILNLEEVNTRY